MSLSKMSIEELELLSYTDIAKLYLEENKKTLNTANLFKEVCNLLSLSESEYSEKITDFFQTLTTSKDFILLPSGEWDLKCKHSVKVAMDELYEENGDEEEDYETEPEDITEEDEFNSIDDEEDYADDDLSDLTILTEDELDSE
jgi:DNA-directed RNA polymerase subunit delta